MTIRFTVYGAPRTKKTSNQVVTRGRVRVLPSKAWMKWVKTALVVADERMVVDDRVCDEHCVLLNPEPYNIKATFYRDANRGDAVGYYQGIADLLEKRHVIADDKWLVSWDGSRLEIDRKNPRVEIVLTPCVS